MVASLSSTPTPCPRCGTGLVDEMFPEHRTAEVAADPAAASGVAGSGDLGGDAGSGDLEGDTTSVRPPDLHPATDGPVDVTTAGADEGPATAGSGDDGSIRPPDLVPVMVRDEPRDVLAGWDEGVDAAELERWREDRPPFPTDAAVVLGAGAAGALLGALAGPPRGRNAALGGLAGIVGAAVVRQLWRLDP